MALGALSRFPRITYCTVVDTKPHDQLLLLEELLSEVGAYPIRYRVIKSKHQPREKFCYLVTFDTTLGLDHLKAFFTKKEGLSNIVLCNLNTEHEFDKEHPELREKEL